VAHDARVRAALVLGRCRRSHGGVRQLDEPARHLLRGAHDRGAHEAVPRALDDARRLVRQRDGDLLLCFGAKLPLLIGYFVVFSIGEAIWSSRFLEYAAEIAPEGRVAQYMGVANLPWFVAKTTTGFYSGFILEKFVPKDGEKNGATMWLIYGAIALLSPVALMSARKWLRSGMTMKAA